MELIIERLTEPQFGEMRGPWNELLRKSASDNFFLRWEWMHAWWEVFNRDRTLCILTARSGHRLIGIAPFYVQRQKNLLKSKVLRFCSDNQSPDYMDLIIESGHETQVLRALWEYLHRERVADMAVLDNLLPESILLKNAASLPAREIRIIKSQICPYLDLKIEDTYDAYMQRRKKIAKISEKEFRWKREALMNEHGVTHVFVEDEGILPKAIEDLFHLHRKRAGDKEIKSNFAFHSNQEFHLKLSRLLLKEKLLNLHLFYKGDKPLAADYSFKYKNKYYGYQKGLEPEWRKLSVGTILQNDIIKQAFAQGISEVDFLKGDEKYKASWVNASREEFDLTVYLDTTRGRLLNRIEKQKTKVKKLLKPYLRRIIGPIES